MFSGYYPHGQYYIKELSVPKGWKMNPKGRVEKSEF